MCAAPHRVAVRAGGRRPAHPGGAVFFQNATSVSDRSYDVAAIERASSNVWSPAVRTPPHRRRALPRRDRRARRAPRRGSQVVRRRAVRARSPARTLAFAAYLEDEIAVRDYLLVIPGRALRVRHPAPPRRARLRRGRAPRCGHHRQQRCLRGRARARGGARPARHARLRRRARGLRPAAADQRHPRRRHRRAARRRAQRELGGGGAHRGRVLRVEGTGSGSIREQVIPVPDGDGMG